MSAHLHAAPSPKAIHYAVLKGKMLKRNPTRIELKDVDEEFTNVERAQGGGTDNNMSLNSLDRSGMTMQSSSDMDRSRDSYFNTPPSSTGRDS